MKRIQRILLGCLIPLIFLSGCQGSNLKVVLHTGFGRDEVFRIEQTSCSLSEIMVYLTNTQCRYEKIYGEEIWETSLEGVTLEENIKEMVLAQISQIKAMVLLAEAKGVELTPEEEARVGAAAEEYYGSLSETEIEAMGVKEAVIRGLYREYALSNKVYCHMIKDINPEVSDDEARTITVEHILIKTYTLDEQGNRQEFGPEERQEAYARAHQVWELAVAGEDFSRLADDYNEDTQSQYSFRKGQMNKAFETAAFHLGKEEISQIVETQYGYHIIKCITTFNQEETDANKIRIIEERREEVFNEHYTAFTEGLTRAMNTDLWQKVHLLQNEEIDTADFFEIYQKYFGEDVISEWL